MLYQDPIRIVGPLGRIYSFTRRYHGDDFFEGPRLAFHHDRAYARDHLLRLTRSVTGDPFNYRLLDVWQLVFQKPWTRPRNLNELVFDLTDKIHRGELFVYLEPNLERNISGLLKDGPPEGGVELLDIGVLNWRGPQMDRPRVSGHRPVNRPGTWGEDYASGLTDTVSAISSDIASEQAELYDSTSGWGNVMYPVFKPVENFGSFIGNTVGLMSALSPKGMNPKVAEYWHGIGESFRALGNKVVDAVGGDGRAAGEITPALASILVTKKVPDTIRMRSVNDLKGVEPASPELISAVSRKRDVVIAQPESEELRMLDYFGAEASVGGVNNTHILLRENPSKAALLEEFLHGTQTRLGITERLGTSGFGSAETHVKDFMIRHRRILGIGQEDVSILEILKNKGL